MKVFIRTEDKVEEAKAWLAARGFHLHWDLTFDAKKMQPIYHDEIVWWKPVIDMDSDNKAKLLGILFTFPDSQSELAMLFKLTFG